MGLGTRTRNLRRPRELNKGLIKAESQRGSSRRARRRERGRRRRSFGLGESRERSSTWDATEAKEAVAELRRGNRVLNCMVIWTLITDRLGELSLICCGASWLELANGNRSDKNTRTDQEALLAITPAEGAWGSSGSWVLGRSSSWREDAREVAGCGSCVSRKKSSGRKRRRTSSKL